MEVVLSACEDEGEAYEIDFETCKQEEEARTPLRGLPGEWQEREKKLEEDRKWVNEQSEHLMKLSDDVLKKIALSPPTAKQHLGLTIQKMAEDVLFARATADTNPENPKHRRGDGGANPC